MTADLPLYMRDPEAWRAHLIEGNARQARKRVSAHLLVRDAAGGILLVDLVYKPGWDLPGGMAEANEPPPDAARREVREELGLESQPRRMLCVEWVSPHGPWDDLLAFIFDGEPWAQVRSARCGPQTGSCGHSNSAPPHRPGNGWVLGPGAGQPPRSTRRDQGKCDTCTMDTRLTEAQAA